MCIRDRATAELAAAVSNGGGIGLIAAGNAPADVVRAQIQKAKSLTDKPFGVNVMMMSPFVEEVMQVIIEEKPAVVATGAGNPGKYIPSLKEAGIKIIDVYKRQFQNCMTYLHCLKFCFQSPL